MKKFLIVSFMLFSLVANAEVKNASGAQTKTLTIDFSNGNEWVDAFQYRTSPIRGKKYEVADGWVVKFSDGANFYEGQTQSWPKFKNSSEETEAESHIGPWFSRYSKQICWIFGVSNEKHENTGMTLYNKNGKHATKITYYYDYAGLDPVLSANNENKDNVGFSINENCLYTYYGTDTYFGSPVSVILLRGYKTTCEMNEPVNSINFSVGKQDPKKDMEEDIEDKAKYEILKKEELNSDLESINWADGARLYKVEIEYTEDNYPTSYDDLLAAYKKLQDNYEDAKASVNFLLQNVVELTNNRDSLNKKIEYQQQQIEEYEAEHEEDMSTLANAQAIARKYRSLYGLERNKTEEYAEAYPDGVPSLDMCPTGFELYDFGLFPNPKFSCEYRNFGLKFGKDDELSVYSNNIYNAVSQVNIGQDGSLYVGTKQGYRITRIDLEYSTAAGTADPDIAVHNTLGNGKYWEKANNMTTFVAASSVIDNKEYINIRGVNIKPAEGVDVLNVTNIRVWTEKSDNTPYDWKLGTDDYFDWKVYNTYKDDSDGVPTLELGPKTSGQVYDLSGRRLSNPRSGINIVDGKKLLVK